jgi:glycerol-3-phosphate dehydrogenase
VIVGTTDTPLKTATLEPCPLPEEIDFILEHASKYLTKDPSKSDILSVFAGIRPLVNIGDSEDTAKISRDHFLLVSESGLVTITGGKWTTYRKMAEDTIDQASLIGCLTDQQSVSKTMQIHGWSANIDHQDPLHYYGSDIAKIKNLIKEHPKLAEKIHPDLPYLKAQVVWAMQAEMARTVEDVLTRRTRAILLNAKASMECAPNVAKIMAKYLHLNRKWKKEQVKSYLQLAANYLPNQGRQE